MAMPILQLGQCGNQVGSNFYDIMFDQALKSSYAHQSLIQQFFFQNQKKQFKAKALQIDMEPKVVHKNLNMKKNWGYSKKLSFVQEEGSGNNWAYGYLVHGQKIRQKLENLITNFAEGQDYVKAFTQIQSMAGGTGSGLGSYVSQMLNQMFPKTPKFAICIMPHLSGQVILQSYNACLSLSTMYNTSDGIFIIQNDQINSICSKQLKINKISLQDINQVIGRNLASVFFPVVNKNSQKIFSIEQNQFNYGVDLIQNIFSDSRFKLASIKTSPNGAKNTQGFNSDTWQAIQNDLKKKKYYKIKNQMIIVRGADHETLIKTKQFTLFDKHNFYNYPRSMAMIENSQKFNDSLNKILDKSYHMFLNNAYVHQYQKFGLQRHKFLESFANIQNIILNYSKI